MKKLDTRKEPKMTEVSPMYVYATEMVGHYYKSIGLKGKRVLTIAGSGDQVANALFYEAGEVIGFDINRNALYMTELKLSAIRALSYNEFFRYFSQTKAGFDEVLYHKIFPLLSSRCQKYFDKLYKEYGSSGLGVSSNFRQRGSFVSKNKAKEINAYLATPASYRQMKAILEHNKPKLQIRNVLELATNKEFNGEYFDVINLSNVPNYLTGKSFGMNEDQVCAYFCSLKKLLTKQGVFFFYSYDDKTYPTPISPSVPPVSSKAFLKKVQQLDSFTVSSKSFPGLHDGKRDRITMLGRKEGAFF